MVHDKTSNEEIFTNQFMKVAILCFGFASALADAGYGYGGYGRSYGGYGGYSRGYGYGYGKRDAEADALAEPGYG